MTLQTDAQLPTQLDRPGIYDLTDAEYHADPVGPAPSLSRSIARILIEASPAHAYAVHPRLGGSPPTGPASGDADMDVGSAVHALFLQGVEKAELISFDSYRSNAAKEARDAARAAGHIPLKPPQYDAAKRVVERLEAFRQSTGLFTHGKPEQTVIWNEGDHWARCRIDWLPDDPSAPLLDLKTTGGLATLGAWGPRCFEVAGDIQAAMYPRGCEFVRGEAPDGMLFVVIETDPPFAIRVFGLDPVTLRVGEDKAAAARAAWVQCMNAGQWPSYPRETEWILPPPWIVHEWESSRVGGIGRAATDPELIRKMVEAGSFG